MNEDKTKTETSDERTNVAIEAIGEAARAVVHKLSADYHELDFQESKGWLGYATALNNMLVSMLPDQGEATARFHGSFRRPRERPPL